MTKTSTWARETTVLQALEALALRDAALYAEQAELLHDAAVTAGLRDDADAPEWFPLLDLAATLRIGQGAAAHRLDEARRLVQDLPATLAGLRTGAVLTPQARLVLEITRGCAGPVAAEVDRRLHAAAPDGLAGWIARRLRTRLRALVLQVQAELAPDAQQQREQTARDSRRVSVRPEPDGMASLWALLPAEQARAFTLGLDALHARQRHLDRQHGIVRTADQRRADLLAQLPALALHALDGTTPATAADGRCSHPAVVLNVHVPMATTLGLSSAPGHLDGYGPLSTTHLRTLLPDARLRRVLVDATTGQPLHADSHPHPPTRPATTTPQRQPAGPDPADRARLLALLPDTPVTISDRPEPQHDPSQPLTRLVQLRDPLCTGPGCSTPSTHSDLDHEIPWPLGPTSAANLRPKSRRCHRAKTFTWTVRRTPDGTHHWTSPTGRSYPVAPYWPPPPTPRHPTPARPTRAPRRPPPEDHDHPLTDDLPAPTQTTTRHPDQLTPAAAAGALDDEPPF